MRKQDKAAADHATDFDLWLACWTQEEIAEDVGCTQAEIAKSIPNGELAILNKTQQAAADHATDPSPARARMRP
jgi:hypothetical protein